MIISPQVRSAWLVMMGQQGWWTVQLLQMELGRQGLGCALINPEHLLQLTYESKLRMRQVGGVQEFAVTQGCLPIRSLTLGEMGLECMKD